MWIKYRTTTSSGKDDWKYEEFKNNEEIKTYLQSVADIHNWSEHWRGIDWFKIKIPPKFYLEEKLKSIEVNFQNYLDSRESTIKAYKDKIERFKKLLKVKQQKITPVCSKCNHKTYCKPRDIKPAKGKIIRMNALNPLQKNSIECIKKFITTQKK